MGDPKRQINKFSRPSHPWQAVRIEEERELLKSYGLRRKSEIWKGASKLKKFREIAKRLIASSSEQAKKEEKQLLDKLERLNILSKGSKIEDVLNLNINSILDRRLQTIVYNKNFARTPLQARQFIIHRHICIGDQVVDIPSFLVSIKDESLINFLPSSCLKNEEHPERKIEKKEKTKEVKKKKVIEKVEKPKELSLEKKPRKESVEEKKPRKEGVAPLSTPPKEKKVVKKDKPAEVKEEPKKVEEKKESVKEKKE